VLKVQENSSLGRLGLWMAIISSIFVAFEKTNKSL